MGSKFSAERSDPDDRNGAEVPHASPNASNGFGGSNGNSASNGNGFDAVTSNGNGNSNGNVGSNGSAHGRLAPTGASAVVRPVPGGEHKGMLKLVEFTQPANGNVARNPDQTLTYRPDPGFTGKDSFQYTLRDEAGTQFSATITVAVSLDVPAFKPATARPASLRAPAPTPIPQSAKAGEELLRLRGGPVPFPGE